MSTVPRPSISKPLRTTKTERTFAATSAEIYAAWTIDIERWFAQPGTLSMLQEEGRAWFFYNREDWGRHPHYGRFLRLHPQTLIETTWLTGNGTDSGTCGAETVLTIELISSGENTRLKLTHAGFVSDQSRDAHAENWPVALDVLAEMLSASSRTVKA